MKESPASTGSLSRQVQDLGNRIPAHQRFWIASAAIALLTVGMGVVLIHQPWEEQRRRMASRTSEQQQRMELLQVLENQIRGIRDRKQGILLEGGAPVLTSQISILAKATGVEIDSVIPHPETPMSPYTRYQIEVTVSADLRKLTDFLHAIEHHKPLLTVDEIEVERPSAASASSNPYASSYGVSSPNSTPFAERLERIKNPVRQVQLLISGYARQERKP